MCNFGRGCYEEQFCEIILNLGQCFRCLKDFLSRALTAFLFGEADTFMQFLKEGIMGNIHVKLFGIWTSDSGGESVKENVYGRGRTDKE